MKSVLSMFSAPPVTGMITPPGWVGVGVRSLKVPVEVGVLSPGSVGVGVRSLSVVRVLVELGVTVNVGVPVF